MEAQADKAVVARGRSCTRMLEVVITPPERSPDRARLPLNLSLVLDRSGSMQGEKLHFVKQAAAHVIDLLEESDRASVIVYDDEVDTLVSPCQLSARSKQQARSSILAVESGNSTFLSGGWLKGCEHVAAGAGEGTINRTLLLTDGLANRGITGTDELATHARELFRRGVSTSCFGVGLGYDEHLLEAMANSGGGNFHFLETVNAIPLVFEREFADLVEIAYREVELDLQLPDGLRVEVLAGWPVENAQGGLRVAVGSLYAGRAQRIYLRLEFSAKLTEAETVLPIVLRAKDAQGKVRKLSQSLPFERVSVKKESAAPVIQAVCERFAEVDLADKANEALKRERAGDRQGAARIILNSSTQHQDYMPSPMVQKYQHMAREISDGLSESSRKSHHREEYEIKRGKVMERDYRLELVHGHLFTQIQGQAVLLDTGIPISLGRSAEFYFLNEVHPLSSDYLGVTLESLEQLVGTGIDVLLGMDILRKASLTIDLAGQRVSFGAAPSFRIREGLSMDNFMGTPIISVPVDGKEQLMFIDTGARLSYVDKSIAARLAPIGKESDFYPGIGKFETAVYSVPFQLGRQRFSLRCGVLPDVLAATLFVTGKSGIIGTELYQKYLVCLAFPEQELYLGEL